MPITTGELISVLYIIVAFMLIVVLYHALFILVDLRKITRRMNDLTEQVEDLLLKPISVADQAFQWVMDHLEKKKKENHHHVMDHHDRE